MKDRIKAIRKYKNMKQAEFAQVLGIKPNTVTSYETGLRVPSDAVITSICREFNVSEHWLRTGEGDMFIQLSEDADFIRVMTEIQVSDDELIKSILMAYWDLPNDKKAAIRDLVDGILKRYSKRKRRAVMPSAYFEKACFFQEEWHKLISSLQNQVHFFGLS